MSTFTRKPKGPIRMGPGPTIARLESDLCRALDALEDADNRVVYHSNRVADAAKDADEARRSVKSLTASRNKARKEQREREADVDRMVEAIAEANHKAVECERSEGRVFDEASEPAFTTDLFAVTREAVRKERAKRPLVRIMFDGDKS